MKKPKEKIAKELPEIAVRYGLAKEAAIETVIIQIKTEKEKEGIKFVQGKGQHKTQLQRDSEYDCCRQQEKMYLSAQRSKKLSVARGGFLRTANREGKKDSPVDCQNPSDFRTI